MNATDLAGKLAGFLGKHGTELAVIASTLQTVTDHLPIDPGTKTNIGNALNALQTSAVRIGNAAKEIAGEPVEVVISREDVEAAVASYLAAHRPELASGDDA